MQNLISSLIFCLRLFISDWNIISQLHNHLYSNSFQLALVKWHEILFMELHSYLTDALLESIQRDRDGIKISTFVIKPIIDSYGMKGQVSFSSNIKI